MDGAAWQQWGTALDLVATALQSRQAQGWLVGGCLRDALLGLPLRDLDLAVTCEPGPIARAVARELGRAIVPLNRETVRVALRHALDAPEVVLDVSALTARAIEADLLARDYRLNAMALPLEARGELLALVEPGRAAKARGATGADADIGAALPSLLDPLGGLSDLRARRLTAASEQALRDDAGRIIRGARLIAALRLAAAPETMRLAREAAPGLAALSRDHVRDELGALLAVPRAADGLRMLADAGALAILLPGLPPDRTARTIGAVRATGMWQDSGEEYPGMEAIAALGTLDALREWYAMPLPDGLPRIVALRWGLLVFAMGSESVEAEGRKPGQVSEKHERAKTLAPLPLAGAERGIAQALIGGIAWAWRMLRGKADEAPGLPEMLELRHYFASVSDAGVDGLVGAVAWAAAGNAASERNVEEMAARAREALEVYFTDRERLIPPALLTGGDLMREVGTPPGPEIGVLLRAVRAAQLDGALRTREDAIAYAHRLAAQM